MMTTPTAVHISETGCPEYTETLPCEAASARKARILVALALSAWDLETMTETATVVVPGFVANCVTHTACHSIRVTVTRLAEGRVRVAVIDKATKKPAPRTATDLDENGRGLAVVAALAAGTSSDTFRWGKRAWAELAAPQAMP
jgi:hypothetical protein